MARGPQIYGREQTAGVKQPLPPPLTHSFDAYLHSFIQPSYVEHLSCAKDYINCLGYRDDQSHSKEIWDLLSRTAGTWVVHMDGTETKACVGAGPQVKVPLEGVTTKPFSRDNILVS